MRGLLFSAGVLVVFAAMGHGLLLQSQILAGAYRTRTLREREGVLDNQVRFLDAEIARRRTLRSLREAAVRLGMEGELVKRTPPVIALPPEATWSEKTD